MTYIHLYRYLYYYFLFFSSLTPELIDTLDVADSRFDAVVLVTDKVDKLTGPTSIFRDVVSLYGEVCL